MSSNFLLIFLFAFFSLSNVHSYEMMELKLNQLDQKWTSFSQSEALNIKRLILVLEKSPTGKALLGNARLKASKWGLALEDLIQKGSGSLTDTTLTRKFSAHNAFEVSYETKSVVFINQDLSGVNAVLDLAHELVHFTYREPFNPYLVTLSLPDFIHSTIEGTGGEVSAYMMECLVLSELFARDSLQRHGCKEVINEKTGNLSREKVIQKFYKLGNYYDDFYRTYSQYTGSDSLTEFTHLSAEAVGFYSSAYSLPYPLAALKEYESVVFKACENEKRRATLLQEEAKREVAGQRQEKFKEFISSLQKRCGKYVSVVYQ